MTGGDIVCRLEAWGVSVSLKETRAGADISLRYNQTPPQELIDALRDQKGDAILYLQQRQHQEETLASFLTLDRSKGRPADVERFWKSVSIPGVKERDKRQGFVA